jgi:ppGpp synthetase/RelA/SpoT-type nucleotidyltranferase
MRFGDKYILRELRDATRNDFVDWYRSAVPIISAVERQAHRELFGFADLLQPHQLVKLTIRRKSEESFADKIEKTLHDPKEFNKLEKLFPERIGPEQIVKDLVGARFIMYSGPDQLLPIQFFSFRQEFIVSELRLYSIYDSKSPFFSHDILNEIERLYPKVPILIGQKPSGYESIHAIVRFNPSYLRMKLYSQPTGTLTENASSLRVRHRDADTLRQLTPDIWKCLAEFERRLWPSRKAADQFVMNAQQKIHSHTLTEISSLDKIDFELQVRTALQDNWAQIEHRLRYSLDKSAATAGGTTPNRDLVDQAFKAQTVMTSALEKNQYLVLRIDEQKYSAVSLAIQTLSPGKRDMFFQQDTHPQLKEIFSQVVDKYLEIDRDIADANGSKRNISRKMTELLTSIKKLGERSKIDFRKFTTDDDVMKWGKRRYILLMLGYLLIRAGNDVKEKIVTWFHSGDPKTQMPRDTYFATTYLYDHIGFLDTNFRNKSHQFQDYFYDPLVNYRTAGLAVQRREFLIAVNMLDEARNFGFLEKFKETLPENLRILNHARFERRCGQYYWWAYLTNRHENVDDIYKAIERMKNVISMKLRDVIKYPIDEDRLPVLEKAAILNHEQQSAALNLVIYNFFRFVARKDNQPNWDRFDAELVPAMEAIRKLFPEAGTEDAETFLNAAKPGFVGQMLLVQGIIKARYGNFPEALADIDQGIRSFSKQPVRLESSFDRVEVAGEIRTFLVGEARAALAAVRRSQPTTPRLELIRSKDIHL